MIKDPAGLGFEQVCQNDDPVSNANGGTANGECDKPFHLGICNFGVILKGTKDNAKVVDKGSMDGMDISQTIPPEVLNEFLDSQTDGFFSAMFNTSSEKGENDFLSLRPDDEQPELDRDVFQQPTSNEHAITPPGDAAARFGFSKGRLFVSPPRPRNTQVKKRYRVLQVDHRNRLNHMGILVEGLDGCNNSRCLGAECTRRIFIRYDAVEAWSTGVNKKIFHNSMNQGIARCLFN